MFEHDLQVDHGLPTIVLLILILLKLKEEEEEEHFSFLLMSVWSDEVKY